MNDDLVKRLRQGGTYQHDTVPMLKAADRIEQLEAALLVVEGMLSEHLPYKDKCERAYNYIRGIDYDRTR